MMKEIKGNKAFTLIELIVVIAVIGILVLLAAPKFLGYTKDAKLAQIKNDVRAHEDFIVAQLATDDEYTASWTSIEASELENIKGELLDKSGYVKNEYELTDDYFEIPSKLVNTKLKGDFYYAKGGQVYYYETGLENQENNELEFLSKSINLKDRDSEIEHTITLENLDDIKNISVNNGDIEIVKIDGNDVTFKVSNGEVSGDGERTKENIEFKTDFILENLRIYANDLLVDESSVLQKDDELFRYENAELTREYTGGPSGYEQKTQKCYVNSDAIYQLDYEYGEYRYSGGNTCLELLRLYGQGNTTYSKPLNTLLTHKDYNFNKDRYVGYYPKEMIALTSKNHPISLMAQEKLASLKGGDVSNIDGELYIGDLVRNFDAHAKIESERIVRVSAREDYTILPQSVMNKVVPGGKLEDFERVDWYDGLYTQYGLNEIDDYMRNEGVNLVVSIYIQVDSEQSQAEMLDFENGLESAEWTYTGTATKVNEYYDYNIEVEYTEAD